MKFESHANSAVRELPIDQGNWIELQEKVAIKTDRHAFEELERLVHDGLDRLESKYSSYVTKSSNIRSIQSSR